MAVDELTVRRRTVVLLREILDDLAPDVGDDVTREIDVLAMRLGIAVASTCSPKDVYPTVLGLVTQIVASAVTHHETVRQRNMPKPDRRPRRRLVRTQATHARG